METLLLSSAFLLSVWGTPVYASQIPDPPPIVETIEQQIDRVAVSHSVATTTLFSLVWAESRLDPLADNGEDRGLVQINRKAWPEITDEQAFDTEWSLHWAAEKLANDEESIWVVCNCYSYARVLTDNLPKMSEIIPNTNIPRIGEIAVFYYKGKKHIGVVSKVLEDGFETKEANFFPCFVGKRFIEWDNKNFVGFYSPDIGSSPD